MEKRKSSFDDHLSIIESGHSKTAGDRNQKAGNSLLQKLAEELGIGDAAQTAAAAAPAGDVAGAAGVAAPSAEGERFPSEATVQQANEQVVAAIDAVITPQMTLAGGSPEEQAAGMIAAASQPVAAQPAIGAVDGNVTDSNSFSKDPMAAAAAAMGGGGEEGIAPEVVAEAEKIGRLMAHSFQNTLEKQAADQEYTEALNLLNDSGLLAGYNLLDTSMSKTASVADGYLEKIANREKLTRGEIIGAAYELIDLQKYAELAEEQGRQEARDLVSFLTKVAEGETEDEGKEEGEGEEGEKGESEEGKGEESGEGEENAKVAALLQDRDVVAAVQLLKSRGVIA